MVSLFWKICRLASINHLTCGKKRKKFYSKSERKHEALEKFKVKVEVHSSSLGAGSDTNLSSPEISDIGKTNLENEYEDIYVIKENNSIGEITTSGAIRRGSRDSGSHSRSESISSINSNVIRVVSVVEEKLTDNQDDFESGVSSASPSDLGHSEEEQEVSKVTRGHHTLPHQHPNSRLLKRVVSEPNAIYCPPPPPPPPPSGGALNLSPVLSSDNVSFNTGQLESSVTTTSNVTLECVSSTQTGCSTVLLKNDDTKVNSEINHSVRYSSIPNISERTKSAVVTSASESVSSTSPASAAESTHGLCSSSGVKPHLVNKQLVLPNLPFIPPNFSNVDSDSNSLIKPSEYLKSIAASKTSVSKLHKSKSELNVSVLEDKHVTVTVKEDTSANNEFNRSAIKQEIGPPPPPLPDSEKSSVALKFQPMSFISTNDLTSVQLRKTEKTVATKTMSAPYGATTFIQPQPFQSQKQDLIAELKMSKDISGIKKLKVERVKLEEKQEKEFVTEFAKQFSIENFVEKIPDTDSTGNPIPPWKRQMLAKKAAEKAKKELEEQVIREAENRRLQAIPAWKRQLLQSKKTDDKCYLNYAREAVANSTEMTVNLSVAGPRSSPTTKCTTEEENNKENNIPSESNNHVDDDHTDCKDNDEPAHIIPWRAQLRKTNSKLNLLE